jgi:hypothetical protein
MATATDLALRISYRVHDKTQVEISAADMLTFLNDAVDDLVAAGWLEPQTEDESTTMAADTYEYNIPAGFAFIDMIIQEDDSYADRYNYVIPELQWRIALDATADPEIHFDSTLWAPVANKKIKIIGQKRPAQALSGATVIVNGMESFIRERATHYAAAFLAAGGSELQQQRKELSEIAYRNSERMLAGHPMEFRVRPSSRHVIGR